ncbi:hypothetical protein P691DRAFT_25814 [Macrolepiota fuliginosa MF-IS2]|uniref:Uncharacterized protein n=1 Tax=Macrolepiota fuliginosa MF-IS2 TaxID=1400762 RepID=A0A9P6C955_9AGAR|nr:hypothetical protein P691DRAFT_25814 [Macrolepiota fuliginosa MF-IS2]
MELFLGQEIIDWCWVGHRSWVRIEPLIYQSIILPGSFHDDDAEQRFQLFSRTFNTGTKPKAFYMQYVKSIFSNAAWWENNSSSDFEVEFLSVCHASIENLECWSEPCDKLNAAIRTMHFPKLKTLCINIDLFPQGKHLFTYPVFQNVTHLDIGSHDAHQITDWSSLESLRCLTHMRIQAVSDMSSNQAMDEVIKVASQARRCFPPNLQYFVILINADLLWEAIIVKAPRRWGRFNAIRLGKFDRRILLGCFEGSGDFDVEEEDQEEINRYEELVAILPHPTEPKLEPWSAWEEVARIAGKREKNCNS